MKKIIFVVICLCLLFVGCAHTPLPTASLTNSVKISTNINNLHFAFVDARSEQFRTDRYLVLQSVFPIIKVSACGDAVFDTPLNVVFEKMFLKRFPDNPNGYQTEVKLAAFYFTHQPHELFAIPFINLFVMFADVEFHGIIKMEVAVLDRNGKYIFTKIYDANIKEMKPVVLGPENPAGFDMLNKAFLKVTDELDTDLRRIKFD
jgi:hypothetical protein